MVQARAERELPEVIAHTAYYAMHHAAFAVLVSRDIPPPRTHSGLITRLSRLDLEARLQAKEEVARLSRALDRRLIADYDAVDTLTAEHARAARDDAAAFVAFCEKAIDTG